MAEEFITDIIGAEEVLKTEAEFVAEIQEPKTAPDKPVVKAKPEDAGSEMATEPDLVESDKAAAGDDSAEPEAESADVKALAAQLGWREDHKGEDAVDAKTYILKSKDIQQSMGKHNKDLKDQLHVLNSSVSALKQHNESVYQSEVKKLTGEVDALKRERRAAIELADVTKVDELDKQIDEKQKDIDAPKPDEDQAAENPVYNEWVKDNQWYLEDNEMAKYADAVAGQYAGAPLDRIYTIVQAKVKEVFPEKFEAAKPAEPAAKAPVGPKSPVEGSSAKVTEGSFTKADLSAEQTQIMNQFVRSGIMTEDQYVNDIAKMQ